MADLGHNNPPEAVALFEDAAQAAIDAAAAKAAEKAAANVKGSEGFRAAGLRTVRKAIVTDPSKIAAHYANHPQDRKSVV